MANSGLSNRNNGQRLGITESMPLGGPSEYDVMKTRELEKSLENLKAIDLSFSKQLIEIPDLFQALNVENVTHKFCERLRKVPSYFAHLDKLTSPRNVKHVNLQHCTSLESADEYLLVDIYQAS